MTAPCACALAAGTASQRPNSDAATTRTRRNVVLVVISHPRGEKGEKPLCTYGRFACCRARSCASAASLRPRYLAGHVTGTATKNRKPPLSRRRSISASGEDSVGISMTTGRNNSGGMTKRHMHHLGRPLGVANRPGRVERAGTYRRVQSAARSTRIHSNPFRGSAHPPVKQAPR